MSYATLIAATGRALGGKPAAVALGGGADSAVACWLVVQCGVPVRGLFVDHGLPGSPALEAASGDLCRFLGVERAVLAGQVDDGPDLERRARDIRHRALAAATAPGERLVTGHTRSDQAETVLLQLIRGAGAAGLSAMARDDDPILRPLLGVGRPEVREMATRLGLPFVDDPANDDQRFTRNRVRHQVMPLLESIRPGAEGAIARAAAHLAADDAHLRAEAAGVEVHRDEGAVLVSTAALLAVDRAVAARVILDVLARVGGSGNASDVDRVLGLATGGGRRTQLSRGRTVEAEGAFLAVFAESPPAPEPVTVAVPGTVSFGAHRLRITATPLPPPVLALDPVALPATVVVRPAAAGDRIAIRGGSKPVAEALAEAGVPRRLRRAWPVVVADGNIAAVPGARVAWWARGAGEESLSLIDERVPG